MKLIEQLMSDLMEVAKEAFAEGQQYTDDGDDVFEDGLDADLYTDILGALLKTGIPLDRLGEICAAEKEGRCAVLPPTEDSEYNGLKVKYRVYKATDNTPVENCFVLRPDKDHAARYALFEYARNCGNPILRADIEKWIYELHRAENAEAEAKGSTV